MIRCPIIESQDFVYPPPQSFPDELVQEYNGAFEHYKFRGHSIYALFEPGFFTPRSGAAQDQPDWAPLAFDNNYITGFSDRAREVALKFFNGPGHVEDFIIWNEPNAPNTLLPRRKFAALMYHCWYKIRAVVPTARVYWEGVFIKNLEVLPADDLGFIEGVYQDLQAFRIPIGEGDDPLPWTGINVHIHRPREPGFVNALFDEIEAIKGRYGDETETIVGEFAVTITEGPANLVSLMNSLQPRVNRMFLFSHHPVHETILNEQGVPEVVDWGLRVHDYSTPGYYRPGPVTDAAFHAAYDERVGA
jgi:hypothetical protein